jgi:predicted DNA-binding protein (MmcQ/YjbR family)
MEMDVLDRLRKICLTLPGASETSCWGHPNFRAGKRIFASFDSYRGGDCVFFKAEPPAKDSLLGDERFFRAPYAGNLGWVCVRARGRINWRLLKSLLVESHRPVSQTRPRRRVLP